jgi:predicted phage terminase large subunit-like protein
LIDRALLLAEAEEHKREIFRARARRGTLAFTRYTMPTYDVNWHHRLTCRYLNMFLRKEISRLMVFQPPRHGKSELTSRRLPALIHGIYPNDEILAASYNSTLADDMTEDVQKIMDTPAYQELFPMSRITPEGKVSRYKRTKNEHLLIPMERTKEGLWIPANRDSDPAAVWRPTGSYRSAGVGGSFTGRGGDWFLIDDPIKNRQDADSKAYRDNLYKWYTSSARTRMEGYGQILLTVTLWHEDDIANRLMRLMKEDPNADQWVVLRLPALAEDSEQYPRHPEDPRAIGEALWPGKFDERNLMGLKASVGSRDWASLYQQRPTAPEGALIKREWIKYYKQLPTGLEVQVQSWDFAVKDKEGSDFTVGGVLGKKGADKYLIDMTRGRMNFPAACDAVRLLSGKHPKAYRKLIEDKANGPAVIQTLKKQVPGLIAVEPQGDKVARLNAVAPDFEAGNVYLPDPSICPWVKDVVDELCSFPNGAHDDIVDMLSQGLVELRRQGTPRAPITGHGSQAQTRR